MICKWCGDVIKPGAKACKRCHNEVQALSDCGGFYDLVPQARSEAAFPAAEPPAAARSHPLPEPVRPVLPSRRRRKSAAHNLVFWAAVLLAVVFLISTLSLSGKLTDAQAQIQRLENQLDAAEDIPTSPTKPNIKPLPPTEPEEEPQPSVPQVLCVKGEGKLDFTQELNDALNQGKVEIRVLAGGQDEDLLTTITLEIRPGEENTRELALSTENGEITAGWAIRDAIKPGTTLTIDWEEHQELKCDIRLTIDEEEFTITIDGIVVENN